MAIQEKLLMMRYNRGDRTALRDIYERYKHELVSLAAALLHDKTSAEDAVHDVFVKLADTQRLKITQNLRSYLFTAVANRARQQFRLQQKAAKYTRVDGYIPDVPLPVLASDPLLFNEQQQHLAAALSALPYDQREVVLLRHFADLKFKTIASMQQVSINTVQGRYRYGLDKLRSLLNGELL